jgi:site-specific recombinase XerD
MARREDTSGSVVIRLSANHFAFLRGYLEGLDVAALARRYLETATTSDSELLAARRALRWIREQLVMAARRRGQLQDARLILIEPDQLRTAPARAIPSLDEFRDERDPHELLSETELIALFREEYGDQSGATNRRALRNERLRRRQLQALLALEALLVTPPTRQDSVGGWFHPKLAARLQAAGLGTLGELATAIEARGFRWWTRVPRVGRVAATQITAWFRTEAVEQALGVRLGLHALTKPSLIPPAMLRTARAPGFGIVPLEFLRLPPELDGSAGHNRNSPSRLSADTDLAAVQAWLATKPEGSSTWRAYRKEAERFLLWTTLERGRSLSSLSDEDCSAYLDFLQRVGTSPFAERWCAPRGTRRWSLAWRPFEGALSPASCQQAQTILASLFRWLVREGYLRQNPWPETLSVPANNSAPTRGLSPDHWHLLEQALNSRATLATDGKAERLRFALALCRETGMRLSELAHATLADMETAPDGRHMLRTATGRRLPLSAELLHELDRYLDTRGLDRASAPPSTSLIGRLPAGRNPRLPPRPDGPELSPGALYQSLKSFLAEVANTLDERDADTAAHFRRASTEWLRGRIDPKTASTAESH